MGHRSASSRKAATRRRAAGAERRAWRWAAFWLLAGLAAWLVTAGDLLASDLLAGVVVAAGVAWFAAAVAAPVAAETGSAPGRPAGGTSWDARAWHRSAFPRSARAAKTALQLAASVVSDTALVMGSLVRLLISGQPPLSSTDSPSAGSPSAGSPLADDPPAAVPRGSSRQAAVRGDMRALAAVFEGSVAPNSIVISLATGTDGARVHRLATREAPRGEGGPFRRRAARRCRPGRWQRPAGPAERPR